MAKMNQTKTDPVALDAPGAAPLATADAVRRRLLLKGIGKGSAVVAAAVPIKSLAFTSAVTANGKICSISGVQSAAHSAPTNLPTCGGLSPGWYKTISHWPNYNAITGIATNTVGSLVFTQNSLFNVVFGGGLNSTLMDILLNQASTDEFHWIAALLNGIRAPSGYVFPYSAAEVLALYAGPQRAEALAFFKGYMETV
jgi:hypothetical protein